MKGFFAFLSLMLLCWACAPDQSSFYGMCDELYTHSVQKAQVEQLAFEQSRDTNILILDTRERSEYDISHIPGALHVGYEHPDLSCMDTVDTQTKVYVYCSVGYRSEKIGEKLQSMGYPHVYNVRGGIFDWGNKSYPLINAQGDTTTEVHGYNKTWSRWINKKKCKVKLKGPTPEKSKP